MDRKRLIELVRLNDQEAQHELFLAFYRRTFGTAYQILRSRETAEDITQEAFVKAFQNLPRLREPGKFGAWLAVIASNLARNLLKRERRLTFTAEPASLLPLKETRSDETAATALRHTAADRVRQALRSLSPEQYQVVVLQYYDDLKIREIAAMLQISTGTVKSRLFRARQKLARVLEPNGGTDSLNNQGGGAK